MVQYMNGQAGSAEAAGRTFAALADPVRLAVIDQLESGGASISELAQPAGISLTGMKKHVRILEEAALVTTEKRGRTRWCELSSEGFDEAAFWLDEFRRRRHRQMNRLEQVIERKKREEMR